MSLQSPTIPLLLNLSQCVLGQAKPKDLCTTTMAHFTGKIEPISTVPDEKLSSSHQIDTEAFFRALRKKPTYKAYKALLSHRRVLECLQKNLELKVEEAAEARHKAFEDITKTWSLAHACHVSTDSSRPIKCPAIAGDMLDSIMESQMFYAERRVEAFGECAQELDSVTGFLRALKKRVDKVEGVLMKKYVIGTPGDGVKTLDRRDMEHVLDAFALMAGIEDALEK